MANYQDQKKEIEKLKKEMEEKQKTIDNNNKKMEYVVDDYQKQLAQVQQKGDQ